MTGLPPPIGFKPIGTSVAVKPTKDEANDKLKAEGLSSEAMNYIMDAELLPEHSADPRVRKFILAYIGCQDVRQASREAEVNQITGKRLRNRRDIHNCIVKLCEAMVDKYGYSAEEVVERTKEIANVDPVDLEVVGENGEVSFVEYLSQIPAETRRAIKKFKAKNIYETDPNGMRIVVGRLIEVELWDKTKAIDLLGREKKLFKETKVHEHGVTQNMADILLGGENRAQARLERMRDVTGTGEK